MDERVAALVFNTSKVPGALARAIASRPVNIDQSKAKDIAGKLMFAQLPLLPTVYPKSPSGKLTIAQRRAKKLQAKND